MSGEHPDRVTPHDPIVRASPPRSSGYCDNPRHDDFGQILDEHARMITALETIAAGVLTELTPQVYAQTILDGCDP